MRIHFTLFFLFIFAGLFAQNFNSVKIDLRGKSISELAQLGLDVEHGDYAKGKHFIGVFSDRELLQIGQAGFNYNVMIENLSDHHRNHDHGAGGVTFRNPGPCEESGSSMNTTVPENFELGSFLGFFTYQEMLNNLDSMAAKYPDLITIKAPIDTFLTHEGRPIFWVKISDNPNVDETEPEILYTAVHHAREPGGMSGLIYYMWHLLENYESDPQVQALVNETELYLVPCLNPDGYIFNEENYFNGGSFFWRKNRRDNGDGTFGVDLNRNYGYEFGFDDNGSSPVTFDATYRGPEGFSEPETQASRAFCDAHEFEIALNYHTFGNLLIYPWGYDDIGTADPAFPLIAAEMVAENEFFAGTALETVGYVANGSSDDWMYGEQVSKPPIFAMSPELGLGGFYPAESEIIPIVQSALPQNVATGLLAHPYGQIADQNELIISSINTQAFNFILSNIGLQAGDFTVTLSGISDNINTTGAPKVLNLASMASAEDFIDFDLEDDITAGAEVIFALSVDNGSYISTDTIRKIFGMTEVLFADNADNLDAFQTDEWAITDAEFVSANTSITDSPNGDYAGNAFNTIVTMDAISLVDAEAAFVNFYTQWEIEAGYDFVQFAISTDDGLTYVPQCGLYTNAGTDDQIEGEPLYDGIQSEWVKEQINLSEYLGQEILLRFTLISDGFVEGDGFYFDDLEVLVIKEAGVSTTTPEWSDLQVRAFPNPADELIQIELSAMIPQSKLMVYNGQGLLVFAKEYQNESQMKINTTDWPAGLYVYELINQDTRLKVSHKIIVE